MTSERQRAANKRNALKSTGPRTAAGKAVVRFNALKHGARAAAPVVPGLESVAEWQEFRTGVRASLQPTGAVEEALADRAAGLLWRLRRVEFFDALSVAADRAALEIPAAPPAREPGRGPGLFQTTVVRSVGDADEEALAKLDAKLAPAKAKIAKYGPARDLARRLAGLDPTTPIDPAAAVALLSACARGLAAGDPDEADVPDPADPDRLLAAAGLAAGGDPLAAPWTAGAGLKALAELCGPHSRKAGAAAFLKEMADRFGRRLAKAGAVVEECEPDAATLRARVRMTRAVARARRVVPDQYAADRIARYEGHLQRQLTATLDQLNRLQERRAGTEGE